MIYPIKFANLNFTLQHKIDTFVHIQLNFFYTSLTQPNAVLNIDICKSHMYYMKTLYFLSHMSYLTFEDYNEVSISLTMHIYA